MSLGIYLLGLGVQLLAWPLLFLLAIIFAKWLHRRREAKGLPRGASWVQFVIVMALVSLITWTLLFVLPKVR
jgi:hypothetical protein